jgi:hypothetical protein
VRSCVVLVGDATGVVFAEREVAWARSSWLGRGWGTAAWSERVRWWARNGAASALSWQSVRVDRGDRGSASSAPGVKSTARVSL